MLRSVCLKDLRYGDIPFHLLLLLLLLLFVVVAVVFVVVVVEQHSSTSTGLPAMSPRWGIGKAENEVKKLSALTLESSIMPD